MVTMRPLRNDCWPSLPASGSTPNTLRRRRARREGRAGEQAAAAGRRNASGR
jgi:hypothetical protein